LSGPEREVVPGRKMQMIYIFVATNFESTTLSLHTIHVSFVCEYQDIYIFYALSLSVMYLRFPSLSECLLELFLLPLGRFKVLNLSSALKSTSGLLLPSSAFCQSDNGPDIGCIDEDLVNLLDGEGGSFWVEEVD
jgi:hypothetical protein